MRQVWTVHVLKDAESTFAEVVFADLSNAVDYAAARSGDAGVRGTAITRFTVGELGSRSTISWFVDGASCDGRVLAARAKKKVGTPGWTSPAGQ